MQIAARQKIKIKKNKSSAKCCASIVCVGIIIWILKSAFLKSVMERPESKSIHEEVGKQGECALQLNFEMMTCNTSFLSSRVAISCVLCRQ